MYTAIALTTEEEEEKEEDDGCPTMVVCNRRKMYALWREVIIQRI